MNALVDYTKFGGGSSSGTPSLGLRTKARIGKMTRAAKSRWNDAQNRKSVLGIENLNDWLLKDVGLVREHLPNGATSVRLP